ncbi:MAG: hypothetical protein HKN54_06060 [Flavobacteriaceae bacterium]|nr:hypothetical protein [Flavobacteriaceae bacterium]
MITRFFSTSKPIHLVLVALYALIIFLFMRFGSISEGLNLKSILIQTGMYLVVFASISIFAFFVNKNNLTQRNSYKILFYALLIAIIPFSLQTNSILISNLFVLMALRRIFSLRNNLRVKKKLFDAAFWITLAAFFHFWAILFFALIFAALLLYSITQLKNWFIPITGFLTVVILYLSYAIISTNSFGDLFSFIDAIDYNYSPYNSLGLIIGMTIILSFTIWSTFYYLRSFKDKQKMHRASHVLVLYVAAVSIVIILISPSKNGSEFIFLFAPLSIIMANYIEGMSEKWFAEIFIWIMIVTPFAMLLF